MYVALLASVLFVALTAIVLAHESDAFDHDLILSLRAHATPLLTNALLAITFTSGRLAVPAVLLFAFALYRRGGIRLTSYYIGACVATEALNSILKKSVGRVRPHGVSPRLTAAGGLSYPSADVMLAVVIFGLGTLLVARTFRARAAGGIAIALSWLFVCLAAVARVYLGAHWPTDVVGGALAGTACAAFAVLAIRRPPVASAPIVTVPAERSAPPG